MNEAKDPNITIQELTRLPETIEALNEEASGRFDEAPFTAAHMRFAALLLCKVRDQFESGIAKPAPVTAGKSRAPHRGPLMCAKCCEVQVTAEGNLCPKCIGKDADADKPAKVKHNYGPEGTCVLSHGPGGATCGERRKRAARAAKAAPAGEGSGT